MIKHILLTTLLIGAGVLTMQAAPLTPEQALARVQKSSKKVSGKASSSATLRYTLSDKDSPTLYIFSGAGGKGFLALSADDSTQPLLGYSDSGSLPAAESDLPPAMRYWLGSLSQQVAANVATGSRQGLERTSTGADWATIAPMTATRWNQDAPYFNDCPTIGSRHCYTGCVATAMAQVLKYYSYPAKGTGTHTYTWNYDENGESGSEQLTFDYGSTTFDWNLMTDTYSSASTDEERAEVARLMYACGVAVNMEYGISGSGAVSFNIVRALIENFGYDKGLRYLVRDYYGIDEWNKIVYDNLVNYGPVLYGGQSNDGGHQFICDGYDEGYFHFNWGWGGMSDGYFLLTALNPESQGIGGSTSGYDFDQDIVIGLSTTQSSANFGESLYWEGSFTISDSSVNVGDKVNFTGTVINYSYGTLTNATSIGVQIIPQSGGTPTYLEYRVMTGLKPEYGISFNGSATLPADLPDGVYTIEPAYKNADGDVEQLHVKVGMRGAYTMTVSGGVATFAPVSPAELKATDFTVLSDIYLNTPFKVSATLSNTSDTQEFLGNVVVGLAQDYNVVAAGTNMALDLLPGESQAWQYEATLSSTDSSNPPAAGTYDLYLFRVTSNSELEVLAGPISVELHAEAAATLKVEDLTIADGQEPSSIKATGTVECTAGYFAGSLSLIIFPGDGGDELSSYNSEFIAVEAPASAAASSKPGLRMAPQKENLSYNFNFTVGKPDTEYLALIYYKGSYISNEVRFRTAASSDLAEVEADKAVPTEFFTLQGVKVEKPSQGIYIVKEGNKVKKLFIK